MIHASLSIILLLFKARLGAMSRKFPWYSYVTTDTDGIIACKLPLVSYLEEIVFVGWFAG